MSERAGEVKQKSELRSDLHERETDIGKSPGQTACSRKSSNSRLVKSAMRTHEQTSRCDFIEDDGGRFGSSFMGRTEARDCVVRALTIAACEDYGVVYAEIAYLSEQMGGRRSARDGVQPKVYKAWLAHRGFVWTPTMQIGSGCTVHMRPDELPSGRLVVRLSGHLCAVIDGVIHDTADPSRDGTRCVYGYWRRP